MKKLALIVSLLTIMPGTASFGKEDKNVVEVVVKNASGSYSYENVVNVGNVSKEEMFKRAKQWVLSNLKTDDNNIGFNEEQQTINSTATLVMTPGGGFSWTITHGLINFKLKLEFRDGRYKFVFDNIVVQAVFGGGGGVVTLPYEKLNKKQKPAKYMIDQVNEKLGALAMSLEAAVKGNKSENDNW